MKELAKIFVNKDQAGQEQFACAFWMQLFSVSILLNLEWGATNHLLRNCVFLQNQWTESFDFPT